MITLHEGQSKIYNDVFVDRSVRHAVVVAARGWGKSWFAGTCAITGIFELMELPRNVPNKYVYIIAPTYDQTVDIYYPMLAYQMGLERYAIKSSRADGFFEFKNDVHLRLVSYEAVERLRGKGAYLVINDEVSSWTKGVGLKDAWESIIQPCIVTRWSPARASNYGAKSPGRSITISTPMGYNYFYDMYCNEEHDQRWKSYHFDYHSSPFLDAVEIESIKHNVDPLKFAREYRARFEDSGNNVFYCFDRKLHVDGSLPYFEASEPNLAGEDVHVSIDFNVGIQASVAWAIRGNQLHALDEFKGHPDTETLAQVLKNKYLGHKIYAYPDPSGNSRKTSAAVGVTDFSILRAAGIEVLAKSKAPPIIDSVNAVNRKLKSAAGDVDIYVHPRCKGLITSLERTKWVENKPELAVIDKSEGIEHFSDGARYIVDYKFPVRNSSKPVARGFGF